MRVHPVVREFSKTVEIINGRVYQFDYAPRPGDQARRDASDWIDRNRCRMNHDAGSCPSLFSLFDGDEMVADVCVCERCGAVIPPCRVMKCGVNLITLGSQRGAFCALANWIRHPVVIA